MRHKVPDTLKYFCQSEAVAYYLQKYVVYRKRKIYVGKRTFSELSPLIKKYKTESFLLPASDKLKPEIPKALDDLKVNWKQAVFYKTVVSDLSNLRDVFYDVLVFFSPSGIESLFENFPDFGYTRDNEIMRYVPYNERRRRPRITPHPPDFFTQSATSPPPPLQTTQIIPPPIIIPPINPFTPSNQLHRSPASISNRTPASISNRSIQMSGSLSLFRR